MSIRHNGKKPGRLWSLRRNAGAFLAACRDTHTRPLARVLRRDVVLGSTALAATATLLNVSATAVTGFIFSYGLPVALATGAAMGAKSYFAYKAAARTGAATPYMRDAVLAAGAVGAGLFLLSSGAVVAVSMAVGMGVPAAAGVGVVMGVKAWMTTRKLSASTPALRYQRKADAAWLEKQTRPSLPARLRAAVVRRLPFLARDKSVSPQSSDLPMTGGAVSHTSTPPTALPNAPLRDVFPAATDQASDQAQETARIRAENRARRKNEDRPRFDF